MVTGGGLELVGSWWGLLRKSQGRRKGEKGHVRTHANTLDGWSKTSSNKPVPTSFNNFTHIHTHTHTYAHTYIHTWSKTPKSELQPFLHIYIYTCTHTFCGWSKTAIFFSRSLYIPAKSSSRITTMWLLLFFFKEWSQHRQACSQYTPTSRVTVGNRFSPRTPIRL